MAEFGRTEVGAQASPYTVQASTKSSDGIAQAVAGLAQTGIDLWSSAKADKAATAQSSFLAGYEQTQLKLAQAVEQGSMSSKEASMKWKVNYSEALASNPDMAADIRDRTTGLEGSKLLGGIIVTGTKEEQARAKLEGEVETAGWFTPNMTDAAKANAVNKYQELKVVTEKMAREKEMIEYEKASVGLDQSKMNLVLAKEKEASKDNATALASGYAGKFSQDMNSIAQQVQAGEIDATQAQVLITNKYNEVDSIVRMAGRDAGGEYLANLAAPFTQMRDMTVGLVSGKIQLDAFNTQRDLAIARASVNMFLKQPKLVEYAAVSAVFKEAGLITLSGVTSEVATYLQNGSVTNTKPLDYTPDTPEQKETIKKVMAVNLEVIKRVNSDRVADPKATKAEMDNQLHNMIKSVDAYSMSVENPQEYQQIVTFLSDPEVGKYIAANGMSKEVMGNARMVLSEQYESTVRDVIKKEYERQSTTLRNTFDPKVISYQETQGNVELPSVIEPHWNGSGVVFRYKEGFKPTVDGRMKLRTLNEKSGKVLNRLVRLSAHLSGGTDYKAAYERDYQSMFGVDKPTE